MDFSIFGHHSGVWQNVWNSKLSRVGERLLSPNLYSSWEVVNRKSWIQTNVYTSEEQLKHKHILKGKKCALILVINWEIKSQENLINQDFSLEELQRGQRKKENPRGALKQTDG